MDRRGFLTSFIPRPPEGGLQPLDVESQGLGGQTINRRGFLKSMGVGAAAVSSGERLQLKTSDNVPINILVESFLNDYFNSELQRYLIPPGAVEYIPPQPSEKSGIFQPSQYSLSDNCPSFESMVKNARSLNQMESSVRTELESGMRSTIKDAFTELHRNGYINIVKGDDELLSLVIEKLQVLPDTIQLKSQNILELGLQLIDTLKPQFEADARFAQKFSLVNLQQKVTDSGVYEIQDWVWLTALANRDTNPFEEKVASVDVEPEPPVAALSAFASRGDRNHNPKGKSYTPPRPPSMSVENYKMIYGQDPPEGFNKSRKKGSTRRGFIKAVAALLGSAGLAGIMVRFVPPVRDLVMEQAVERFFFKADPERVTREMESKAPKLFKEINEYEERLENDREYTIVDSRDNEIGWVRNDYLTFNELKEIPYLDPTPIY